MKKKVAVETKEIMKAVIDNRKKNEKFSIRKIEKIERSVEDIINIFNKSLVPAPCQREFCTKMSSSFILQVILGCDLGDIVVNRLKKSEHILDGIQRLTSLYSFVKEGTRLDFSDMAVDVPNSLKPLEGMCFDEFPKELQKMFLESIIVFKVYHDLSKEQESHLYLMLNSSATPLSVIEQLKAKFTEEGWNKIEDMVNKTVFNYIPNKTRFKREKDVLSMFAISMIDFENSKGKKLSRFTDCIKYLCDIMTESPEEGDAMIDSFVEEFELYQSLLEKLAINGKKKNIEDENEIPRNSYHPFDDRLLFYAFHKDIVKMGLKGKARKEGAKKIKDGSSYMFANHTAPFKEGMHTYKYLCGQGSDNISSLNKAYSLLALIEEEVCQDE